MSVHIYVCVYVSLHTCMYVCMHAYICWVNVMVIIIRMDSAMRVQILDQAIYILHCANALGKDMKPTVLPLAMGKLYGRLGSFAMIRQPV